MGLISPWSPSWHSHGLGKYRSPFVFQRMSRRERPNIVNTDLRNSSQTFEGCLKLLASRRTAVSPLLSNAVRAETRRWSERMTFTLILFLTLCSSSHRPQHSVYKGVKCQSSLRTNSKLHHWVFLGSCSWLSGICLPQSESTKDLSSAHKRILPLAEQEALRERLVTSWSWKKIRLLSTFSSSELGGAER